MNIPIANRIKEMFSAAKDSRCINDNLTAYMFSFLKEDMSEVLCMSIEVQDLIEECQTYVFRDRPLQINSAIEAELREDYATCDELMADIYRQDTAVMCNLVKIRNHIYA